MFRSIERADVVAGVLAVTAVAMAVINDRVTSLVIGGAMVACHYAITRRHIFDSFRSGQRSRGKVIDLDKHRVTRLPAGGATGHGRSLQ